MSYLIRLFSEPSPPGSQPLALRDTQLAGSPPFRFRGLPWRSLQSSSLVLGFSEERLAHATWILKLIAELQTQAKLPFDSSPSPRVPFGDALDFHLDCADWSWSPDQQRWLGHVRNGPSVATAPLFAFWLEQALRFKPATAASATTPPSAASLAFQQFHAPALHSFQIQELLGAELDIFLFALDHAGPSPSLAPPDCLPSCVAQRLALTAQTLGLDAFDLLSHRDPQAATLRESLLLHAQTPRARAAPGPATRL